MLGAGCWLLGAGCTLLVAANTRSCFRYLADAVKDGLYVALVVQTGAAPNGMADRWALATVDLASGKSATLAWIP